jgi:uncharacterized protein YyaL (SSP411 family)
MISPVDQAAIEWITDAVVAAVERAETVEPPALTFLLRRYVETDRADLRLALEPALTSALQCQAVAETTDQRAAWLTLFSEAATVSDDDRIHAAGAELIARLRKEWGRVTEVDAGTASVDACLGACHLLDPQSIVPDAIDELERIVAAAYRPGDGLARSVNEPGGARGRLADHVRTSSALLTAYDLTGRLPYPMLAEELMQFARQTRWDGQAGGFCDSSLDAQRSFATNSDAARVLTRLAALHERSDYRSAAVLACDADYREDVTRILTAQGETYREQGLMSATYGLALAEWLAVLG